MPTEALTTKRQVLAAPVGYTFDPRVPGFALRVRPSGVRTWLLDYRLHNGRQRRMALGSADVLAPDAAYRLALKHRTAIAEGRDPLGEKDSARQAQKAAVSLSKFFDTYVAEYAEGKKKARSIAEDKRLFNYTINERLGRVRVPALTDVDVQKLHRDLKATPVVANRAVALLSKMMNLAEKWGVRPKFSNPCRGVERYREKKKHRFLSNEQLTALGKALAEIEKASPDSDDYELPSVIAAVRLLLFTGCRRGEILALKWEQVDFDGNVLHLTDADTKEGKEKYVVLSAPARQVLDELAKRRGKGSAYVLPGRWPERPLVGLPHAWLRIRKRAGLDGVRLHDLRHTNASTAAGLGVSLPVIGALLGHSVPQTTARYAGIAADPRREAAERVGERLAVLLAPKAEPAPVVELRERKKKAGRRGEAR